jgi:hypothetical protein
MCAGDSHAASKAGIIAGGVLGPLVLLIALVAAAFMYTSRRCEAGAPKASIADDGRFDFLNVLNDEAIVETADNSARACDELEPIEGMQLPEFSLREMVVADGPQSSTSSRSPCGTLCC